MSHQLKLHSHSVITGRCNQTVLLLCAELVSLGGGGGAGESQALILIARAQHKMFLYFFLIVVLDVMQDTFVPDKIQPFKEKNVNKPQYPKT